MIIYLGENIKRLRQENGITQETLAGFLGITFQSVSRWERGDGYPDIALLPEIAMFFGVSVDDLLGIDKAKNEERINEYLELYDTMKLKDLPILFGEYQKAVKDFPGDFRILVRYMQLLQEVKIRTLTFEQVLSREYEKASEEISGIYESIQKHCTDDSIRIWSKNIMISHLMWKYECICNDEGRFGVYDEFLTRAQEIINTLPSMCDSREIAAIAGSENYYEIHKNALEELMFFLQNELFTYCLNNTPEKRILQYESQQNLLNLIYPDGDFGKNCFNRLYNFGHLGHLYHQVGNDKKALCYLKSAAIYAKELDKIKDASEKAKRFYNYGSEYRELSAAQFMKKVMEDHYPLSDEFKDKSEFKEILSLLGEGE